MIAERHLGLIGFGLRIMVVCPFFVVYVWFTYVVGMMPFSLIGKFEGSNCLTIFTYEIFSCIHLAAYVV